DDQGWGRGNRPVMDVDWQDARQYAAWLSKRTGVTFRLPSEMEWEFAARAGATTAYSWGDEVGQGRANCTGCGGEWDGKDQNAPVGSFAPNAFGLHDVHGNVYEWTDSCLYSPQATVADAWLGIERCELDNEVKVLRGG